MVLWYVYLIKTMEDYYQHRKEIIEKEIESIVDEYHESSIHDCLKYCIEGGKKLRSIMSYELYYCLKGRDIRSEETCNSEKEICNGMSYFDQETNRCNDRRNKEIRNDDKINNMSEIKNEEKDNLNIRIICIPEILHICSLIIDDMPYFDNDILRRGKPTVHAKFNSAIAHSSSMALINISLKCLHQESRFNLMGKVIDYLGVKGAIEGQVKEYLLLKSNKRLNKNDILRIIQLKTASFFTLSIYCVLDLLSLELQVREDLLLLGNDLGIAYQIYDDIVDMEKDITSGKALINYSCLVGKEQAIKDMNHYISNVKNIINKYELNTPFWTYLFSLFII